MYSPSNQSARRRYRSVDISVATGANDFRWPAMSVSEESTFSFGRIVAGQFSVAGMLMLTVDPRQPHTGVAFAVL
jgi:hypothetical protein